MTKRKKTIKRTSQGRLATLLGVSRQTVSHHVKTGHAPPITNLAAWQTYLAGTSLGGAAGGTSAVRDEIAKQRLKLVRAAVLKADRENAVDAGRLVSVAEVRRQCAAAEAIFFNSLEMLCRQGPITLVGLTAPQLREALQRIVFDITEETRAKFCDVSGEKYVRRTFAASRPKFAGWIQHPSTNQERQLDALVAKTRCKFPESHAAMEAMLAADDAKK